MTTSMTIDESINRLLTCASDVHCPREEACFEVAKFAKSIRSIKSSSPEEEKDADEVENYAPDWSAS